MAALARAPARRAIDPGDGTPESLWLPWLQRQPWPALDVAELVRPGARAVLVAPHPDDEVLGAGGLLRELTRLGRELLLIAVTDGEASHPASTHWPRQRLARQRPLETDRALALLGVPTQLLRLGFGDGTLAASVATLAQRIAAVLRPGDVLIGTWRLDGHPDHDATGAACARAAQAAGVRLVELPVWAWHWALPQDRRLPWDRARRLRLDADAVRAKMAALQAYQSQLLPDPSIAQPPVLRASIVQRAARPFEIVFV